jgi:dihydroflavonol-4-reductase
MQALVTGATGFVGSHVARLLHDQGATLRLLVRATSRTDLIDMLPADRVTCDLADPAALTRAMQGCDAVFHVAADYRLWARDSAAMYRTNVEGTRAIIDAARQARVRRVVYTSSVATIGFLKKNNGALADEASPVALADMIGHYKRSKFMAEEVAIAAGKNDAPVVVVNPTAPIGEQDIKPTPTGRIILDFLLRKFPAYVETGLNLVDVHEVARGHLAAFERARPGERYVLGGENLTLKQVLDKLAAITGLPSPRVKLPYGIALVSGAADTFVRGKLLGREPRVTLDAVRMGRKKMWASSAKAERELGWRTVPIDHALHRAVAWFCARGYAPAPPKLVRAEVGVPA